MPPPAPRSSRPRFSGQVPPRPVARRVGFQGRKPVLLAGFRRSLIGLAGKPALGSRLRGAEDEIGGSSKMFQHGGGMFSLTGHETRPALSPPLPVEVAGAAALNEKNGPPPPPKVKKIDPGPHSKLTRWPAVVPHHRRARAPDQDQDSFSSKSLGRWEASSPAPPVSPSRSNRSCGPMAVGWLNEHTAVSAAPRPRGLQLEFSWKGDPAT